MQESQQLQLGNREEVSDLMHVEVMQCDTCGASGYDKDLIVCHKCHDGAEHLYCMHGDEQSKLKVREDWTCQECMPREGTDKLVQDEVEVAARRKKGYLSERATNCESSKGSKLKSRSSCAEKSGENSGSSQLSSKRHQVPVVVQSMEIDSNSSLYEDFSSTKVKVKSVNKIVYSVPTRSSSETLFSGPSFCNIDAVESCGQLDRGLLASNHNIHKHEDPNCTNRKKKNESQQGEQPTKAATSMSLYELCSDPSSDERTNLRDMVQVVVVPKADHKWLGKFQINSSEGIARTWDGIQAHLSNCASVRVLEVANRLPNIFVLEELPRLRIWPSQFMRSQVNEKNIALYFFAHDFDSYICYEQLVNYMMDNDLALKGNLDGVELLIFPSNILPENSQYWNGMFFFWGVFRGRKTNNEASTPVSSSLKLKNGDAVTSLAFDLNAYPLNREAMEIVDEIPEFQPSGQPVLMAAENSDSKGGEANAECAVVDINVSLWPKSGSLENGSAGIEDNNVEAPSTSLSLVPPSTIMNPNECKAADALILLSMGYI